MIKYLTISDSYHLCNIGTDSFQLYNKVLGKVYNITFKLYAILSYFYNCRNTIEEVKRIFEEKQIGIEEFEDFLDNPSFRDLLVEAPSEFVLPDYKISASNSDITSATPVRVDFLITKHCNLCCRHCFEGSAPYFEIKEISTHKISHFVNQLKIANIMTLKITGGEPFSHPNIKQILREIRKSHFETIILTNATLIDDEDIELIKLAHVQLGISLDGITREAHDYIRGKGSYDRTVKVLQRLSKENVRFAITCSISRKNKNQLEDIADFVFNKINAEVLYLNRIRPMGRARYSAIAMSDSDYMNLSLVINRLKSIYSDNIILSDDSVIRCKNKSNLIHCAAGNTLLAVDEHFDVYPCIYGIGNDTFKIGNMITDRIDSLWNSPRWNIFRGHTKLSELTDCKDCSHNQTCAMKNCRLKPVYEGNSFYSPISYCKKKLGAK